VHLAEQQHACALHRRPGEVKGSGLRCDPEIADRKARDGLVEIGKRRQPRHTAMMSDP